MGKVDPIFKQNTYPVSVSYSTTEFRTKPDSHCQDLFPDSDTMDETNVTGYKQRIHSRALYTKLIIWIEVWTLILTQFRLWIRS